MPHLPLLPASGLDLSVLLVIVLGTLVLFYLSEAFGWPFGGLVVPGYLASVLVVHPAAGVTVVAEACLTVLVVRVLSDGLGRTGAWTPFFGRERFLLLVVVSILVRQASEVWIWPWALSEIALRTGHVLLPAGDAHSVGLVLVPLTANTLSRGSVRAGILGVLLPTGAAWLLLRHVLLPGTNVSLGAMSLAYQDPSLDFLQSSHAYFILGTGVWVASRLNGAYAWSAGGILVPTLLGLAWYEPWRIVTTLVEALVLAALYRGVTQLPVVRHWNFEGARKLAVLVVLSATTRVALAWLHDAGFPVRTEELSGLGYMLSALVALKILQVGKAPTVLLPAVATSLVAFAGGSAAAWALAQRFPVDAEPNDTLRVASASRLGATPAGALLAARERVRLDAGRAPAVGLPASELASWAQVWRGVEAGEPVAARSRDVAGFLRVRSGAGAFGTRPWAVVEERGDRPDELAGWGSALVREGARGGILTWEHAWSEGTNVDGIVDTCLASDCRAVVVAGAELPDGRDDAMESLRHSLAHAPESVHATPSAGGPTMTMASTSSELRPWAGDLVAAVLTRPPETWSANRDDLAFLGDTFVPALDAWARGEAAFPAVVALAGRIDADAALAEGCGTQPCLVITPRTSGPIIVVRPGAAAPLLIDAPHPHRELGTMRIAMGAFTHLNARALVLDPAEPLRALDPVEDPLHAVHLGWHRMLHATAPDAGALIVRGLGVGEPGVPPIVEDAVVGLGRPVYGTPPAAVQTWLGGARLGGAWTYRWAATGADEKGLVGNHLHTLQSDLALGGLTPAVVWVSASAREKWRGETRDALAEWLSVAGVELTTRASDAAVGDASNGLSEAGRARLKQVGSLARRAAHQHNLNLLRRLVDETRQDSRVKVTAGWDAQRQLGWVEVTLDEARARGACRAWIVPGDDRDVILPAGASTGTIREALGWMPADLWLGVGT